MRGVIIATLMVIIIVAIGAYARGAYGERHGNSPSLYQEVYLFTDAAAPHPSLAEAMAAAAARKASVATPGQVALYELSGGRASEAGMGSTGSLYSIAESAPGHSAIEISSATGASPPYGVWLLGPKPPPGPGVGAFAAGRWYSRAPTGRGARCVLDFSLQ